MLAAKERLVSNVETDHGQRPARLKNNLGGFGVVVDIRFGRGVDVTALDGAAHEDDFLDERDDGGIFLNRERDVGEAVLAVPDSAVMSFWKSGCCAPAATGMSQRLASETMRRAFSRPCLAVVLPGTTVMARTSSSGEWSASMRAMASSLPGSVSKMIFLPEAAAGETRITERKSRRKRNPMLRAAADKLPTDARHRVEWGRENDRTSLANSLSATPLHEQHAALRSRNKPPDRIGRRLAFTLQKCQDKSRVEIVARWKTFHMIGRSEGLGNCSVWRAVGSSARERCYYFL